VLHSQLPRKSQQWYSVTHGRIRPHCTKGTFNAIRILRSRICSGYSFSQLYCSINSIPKKLKLYAITSLLPWISMDRHANP